MMRNHAVVLTTAAALAGVLSAGALAGGAGTTTALWSSQVSLALPTIVDGSEVKAPTITTWTSSHESLQLNPGKLDRVAGMTIGPVGAGTFVRVMLTAGADWEIAKNSSTDFEFLVSDGKSEWTVPGVAPKTELLLVEKGAAFEGDFLRVAPGAEITVELHVTREGGGGNQFDRSEPTTMGVTLEVLQDDVVVKTAVAEIEIPGFHHGGGPVAAAAVEPRTDSTARPDREVGRATGVTKEVPATEPDGDEQGTVHPEESVEAVEPEEPAESPEPAEALTEPAELAAAEDPSADAVGPAAIEAKEPDDVRLEDDESECETQDDDESDDDETQDETQDDETQDDDEKEADR